MGHSKNHQEVAYRQAAGVGALVIVTTALALLAMIGIGDEMTGAKIANIQTTW